MREKENELETKQSTERYGSGLSTENQEIVAFPS